MRARLVLLAGSGLIAVGCTIREPAGGDTAGSTTAGTSTGVATTVTSTGAESPGTSSTSVAPTEAGTTLAPDSTGATTDASSSSSGFISVPDGGPPPLKCTCPADQICAKAHGIDSSWLECALPPAGCDPAALCTAACALACAAPPPLPTNCDEPEPPTWIDCGPHHGFECSVWAVNCPDGEKCTPLLWQPAALICQPLVDPGAGVGEPCTGPLDGPDIPDDCVAGSLCWDLDPATEDHVCAPHCAGTPDAPICPAGTACALVHQTTLPLCLPVCDPLLQDCGEGRVCGAAFGGFACVVDKSGFQGQAMDSCQDASECDPGLTCIAEESLPGCQSWTFGCCAPFCDLGAADCGADEVCAPFFADGAAPPEWAHVGICAAAP